MFLAEVPKKSTFGAGFGDVVSWRFCKIIMGDLHQMSGAFNELDDVGWVGAVLVGWLVSGWLI